MIDSEAAAVAVLLVASGATGSTVATLSKWLCVAMGQIL